MDVVELGAALRESRVTKGQTQKEVGLKVGVHPNVIGKVELGTYSSGITNMHRIIAEHIGIDLPQEDNTPETHSNGALTEMVPARIIQLHKPAGFDPETDGMITCLLALSEMDKDEAVRTLRYLNMRFGE